MTTLWRRLRSAPPEDRGLAAEALALLVAARIGLWVLPFAAVRRLFRALARPGRGAPRAADRVAWSVAAAGRRLPAPFRACLPQALAAEAMLRRHGLAAELKIGVRQGAGRERVEAHAWVLSGDRVVAGWLDDLPSYQPLAPVQSSFQQLLAALLQGTAPPWTGMGCDAGAFLQACEREEIAALVCHHLQGTPEFTRWPAAVRQALGEARRAAVARELLAQRELVRVLDALAAHRVRPLLLKGSALAYTLYPHPSLRPRCDTDLLIREADADVVRASMSELGYAAAVQCDGDLLFRQFELSREDRFGVTHAYDVHWAISTQALFADLLPYEELAPRAVAVPALGANGRALGTVDALLLALIHPVMHHRNEQRLLWVYDVHLLASALDGPGWEELTAHAVSKGIAAVCAQGLRVSQAWFCTEVPRHVLDTLAAVPVEQQPTAAYLAPGRTWAHETASNLRALQRWRDRLRLLREIALPSPGYLLRAYGLGAAGVGKLVLPALYLHRGVRGVLRVVSGRR